MAFFDTDSGLQIAYRSRGRGAPAAFIHPPPLDGSLWLDQLQALGDIRRCLSIDLLGHGLSDPNPAAIYKPSDHARDVLAWLAAVAPTGPIDLVGLGVGGVIAALAVEQAPARFASLTLVSADFGPTESDADQRYHQEIARHVVVEEREVVIHRLMEDYLPREADLTVKARYRSMIQRSPAESVVRVLDGRSLEARPDLPAKLGLPVLTVAGAAEPRPVRVIQTPRLTAVTLAHIGALAPIEDPVALNAALRRFWLEVSPPRAVGLGASRSGRA